MIKIKEINFFNHLVFGNQKFDFTIDGIKPVNNIVIAGENGSGKTKFLEELYKICNDVFYINNPIYSHKLYDILIDISDEKYCDFNNENIIIDSAILTISYNDGGAPSNKITFINGNCEVKKVKKLYSLDEVISFKINGLYSSVDINYKPRDVVKGTTNKTLDNEKTVVPNDMAYEIIQLLVDIAMQDSSDIDSWVTLHRKDIVPDSIYHTRLNRFTNAFKYMFGDVIQYKLIKNNSIPIFSKNGKDIEISSLSSGEKQIIFRGIYLLQNKNSLKGIPVFIDEPEISMHPKWEEKIFDYYRNIFIDNSNQTSQLFIATHSEHILSNILNRDDCLVIKIKNNSYDKYYNGSNGRILPSITISEIKYLIFDLYTTDFHNLLYSYIQENCVSDLNGNLLINATIKQTDDWLKGQGVLLKSYYKQISPGNIKQYDTLPTYIRNCIDHPDDSIIYSNKELEESINKMIEIIKKIA